MDRFDVFVIGGGGTGSEVVGRLASPDGLRVGMAERDRLGGECNWYGCVPSKIMLRSAKIAALARSAGSFGVRIPTVEVDFEAVRDRVRSIVEESAADGARPFEDKGARVILEEVRLTGPNELETAGGERLTADRIVFTTGSEATISPIDGLREGPYWTNKEAIWHEGGVPESLVVIGAGAIGVEFAQIYSRFGSRVTVVEALERVLPSEDDDSGAALRDALEAEGIEILTGAKIARATHASGRWSIEIEGRSPIAAEHVLVATGREPVFDGHDLDAAGVALDERRRPVLTDTLRTTNPTIWAAGDATGELLFTHVGTYEAGLVVDDIGGRPRPRDYRVVPKVTYTDPEVASVGITERAAHEDGREVVTSTLAMADNERAIVEGKPEGHVKLVADARTGELLGGHVVGEGAGELVHEIAIAISARVPVLSVGETIHAYPTLSESVGGAFARIAEALKA
jgi:pyruvate/2-oxoglutarate dehydrogenase complex dihydrolipoamide dehydrogenase (E3) component